MASMKLFSITFAIFVIVLREIKGHGMMADPVARASAWRLEEFKGKTPEFYEDNQFWCGGRTKQHDVNGGKCGVCGDDYALSRPRPNENGGEYGTGVIVRKYISGQVTNVTVNITANHRGKFYFSVCPLSNPKELETEECFDKYPVKLADGSDFYVLEAGLTQLIPITVVLPKGLTCEHCVFRWHWTTGNSWGMCNDTFGDLGCGPQEEFRTCSDITIA